jgi:hypothetical protein
MEGKGREGKYTGARESWERGFKTNEWRMLLRGRLTTLI